MTRCFATNACRTGAPTSKNCKSDPPAKQNRGPRKCLRLWPRFTGDGRVESDLHVLEDPDRLVVQLPLPPAVDRHLRHLTRSPGDPQTSEQGGKTNEATCRRLTKKMKTLPE